MFKTSLWRAVPGPVLSKCTDLCFASTYLWLAAISPIFIEDLARIVISRWRHGYPEATG